MPDQPMTMYQVRFYDYNGKAYFLDTIDPAKIGPWLAEMFMLWPFKLNSPANIQVEAWQVKRPET